MPRFWKPSAFGIHVRIPKVLAQDSQLTQSAHSVYKAMAPDERGSCKRCLTVDWECACEESAAKEIKRGSTTTEEEVSDHDSHQDFWDVVEWAQEIDQSYGVDWRHFGEIQDAEHKAIELLSSEEVLAWYVGVCKLPASRFYEDESALCRKYQRMYPLAVGQNMGKVEKALLKACRGQVSAARSALCQNKSAGGERVHRNSIKFVYLAVRLPVRQA